ncbi:unnamed protein product [Didymodactylos carnosus]|uniref:RING-type domain-containing protein n=1 Tax=Didymodactylos carnosus TaxID=1234261 RepID=A0A814TR29_9BILA|nr:unnamed protein product [Didymodactylos carnosus]CAF1163656.1 unnamed protein product [Didymodactylos carnosus]CAF3546777.1 unnamed protein product [Didymodactylos carnosus]CAF3927276.1 unnamed protein product [Didymodactylos carnosus]
MEAGWFCCGNGGDLVACIYCGEARENWIPEDIPLEIHKRLAPDCYYFQFESQKFQSPNHAVVINENNPSLLRQTTRNGIIARFSTSKYALVPERVQSFEAWPLHEPRPDVNELVRAGFFYSGRETIVQCFYCNGASGCAGESGRDGAPRRHSNPSLCLLCTQEQKRIACLPCGHLALCVGCVLLVNLPVIQRLLNISRKVLQNGSKRQVECYFSQSHAIDNLCVVCCAEEKCLACMPCGHLSTCVPCGHSARSCPICRSKIETLVKIYL